MTSHERWVVFDLGETLVSETRNWDRWARHLGVPALTFFAVLGSVIERGRPHSDAFAYFRDGFDLPAEVERKTKAGLAWGFDAGDLYDDALPALAVLRQAGVRLAVMANQPLEAAGFLSTLPVDVTATSAQWGVSKPDPRFFARICAELNVAPEHVAYVGDRVDNDVLPARASGMTAVHVRRGPWGLLQADRPQAQQAHLQVDSLLAVADGLRALGFLEG